MIYVEIDELTPCLRDSVTGEIVDTEVIPITRKTVLKKFNKQNGWYINWESLFNESEIYALVISGTYSIQGLIAVHNDVDSKTAFIDWAVASPENNPQIMPEKKYAGVGGHLFAIAAQKSIEYGYGGAISGFAANKDLMKHYIDVFGAVPICLLHEYQIFIDEAAGNRIREVYTYEWFNEE